MNKYKINMSLAYKLMFEKYAMFSGRSTRSELWYVSLANFIIYGICIIAILPLYVSTITYGFPNVSASILASITSIFMIIYYLIMLIPSLSLAVRRLHDVGKSGWYYLLGIIPIFGSILLLVYLIEDSNEGDNKYGPNPKCMGPIVCNNKFRNFIIILVVLVSILSASLIIEDSSSSSLEISDEYSLPLGSEEAKRLVYEYALEHADKHDVIADFEHTQIEAESENSYLISVFCEGYIDFDTHKIFPDGAALYHKIDKYTQKINFIFSSQNSWIFFDEPELDEFR